MRPALALWAACLLAPTFEACAWAAANDEANRQRTMQRMRDDSARADRESADRAARRQAEVAASAERSRNNVGTVTGAGNAGASSRPAISPAPSKATRQATGRAAITTPTPSTLSCPRACRLRLHL